MSRDGWVHTDRWEYGREGEEGEGGQRWRKMADLHPPNWKNPSRLSLEREGEESPPTLVVQFVVPRISVHKIIRTLVKLSKPKPKSPLCFSLSPMASTPLSNTLCSHPSLSHRTHAAVSLYRPPTPSALTFQISSPTSRSLLLSTHSKKKCGLFVTKCSAYEEDCSAKEVPIELKYPAFPTVMDVNQIREILPHRFPFLLVDRVIEYNPGVSAVAIKNVTINDNFFPGHFPERPIMPGVLMVEALAQVGGIVMLQPEVGGSQENFFFAGIDNVRFRKPVVAGDTLVMRMKLVKLQRRFGIAKMEGKAYVGGEVVCEGDFLMAMGS